MKKPEQVEAIELTGSEPVLLAGEGKVLRGYVRVHNPGTDTISLREASLRLQLPGEDQPVMAGQSSLSLALKASQAARVKLSFDYDPLIPPGEYPGELEIFGSTHEVRAYLAEVVRLTVLPATIVIDQASGTLSRRVVLGNEGNVALTIGPLGRVPLGKELMLRRGVMATVAAAGEKSSGAVEKIFSEFVREESQAAFSEAGFLELHLKGDSLALEPGEMRAVELEIRLPDTLEAHARYIGRLPLYTSELEFVLVPPASKPVSRKVPVKKQPETMDK